MTQELQYDAQDLARAAVLAEQFIKRSAEIRRASDARPFQMQKVVLDLTTARLEGNPYKISVPIRSLFVRDASDALVQVSVSVNSDDAQSIQNAVPLKINDAFDFGFQVASINLTWAAQSGKSVTLYLFTEASFRSGSQLSISAGGVSISDGTAFTNTVTTLTAATASLLFAADTTRKNGTWRNETGADVWVGSSAVTNSGATKGFVVKNGEVFNWKNSAALYAYSVGGSTTEVVMGEN